MQVLIEINGPLQPRSLCPKFMNFKTAAKIQKRVGWMGSASFISSPSSGWWVLILPPTYTHTEPRAQHDRPNGLEEEIWPRGRLLSEIEAAFVLATCATIRLDQLHTVGNQLGMTLDLFMTSQKKRQDCVTHSLSSAGRPLI